MTAMDFRQYDQALGRFNVMDALSEMAYDQTPYRYGFNNPVFWKDPSGLFETHKQAAKFLSDNGLNGSITYNQDFNGYVVTVQGGEFDGTQFYDFSEVMEDMVIDTTSKRGGGSNGTPVPCVKCHHDAIVENGTPLTLDLNKMKLNFDLKGGVSMYGNSEYKRGLSRWTGTPEFFMDFEDINFMLGGGGTSSKFAKMTMDEIKQVIDMVNAYNNVNGVSSSDFEATRVNIQYAKFRATQSFYRDGQLAIPSVITKEMRDTSVSVRGINAIMIQRNKDSLKAVRNKNFNNTKGYNN